MAEDSEVRVPEYMRLMKDLLDRRISADNYRLSYFALSKRRVSIFDEEASRITQQAYGDADDYEPDPKLRLELPNTIREPELRERVAKSLRDLEALGHRLDLD
jgi:Bacterial self-protective colicin-like immunity